MDAATIIAIAGIVVPIIGGVVAWVMNSLHGRITNLEENHDHLQEKKLDKEVYYREQGAMSENMKQMGHDIKDIAKAVQEWPEKLIDILTKTGKL